MLILWLYYQFSLHYITHLSDYFHSLTPTYSLTHTISFISRVSILNGLMKFNLLSPLSVPLCLSSLWPFYLSPLRPFLSVFLMLILSILCLFSPFSYAHSMSLFHVPFICLPHFPRICLPYVRSICLLLVPYMSFLCPLRAPSLCAFPHKRPCSGATAPSVQFP